MKISKKRLKLLIENYLFEQEEGPVSKEISKDNKKVKIKSMTKEVGPNHSNLSINKTTGEVTLKVTGGEVEKEVSLKPADVEGESQAKADFINLASGYIQDLRRTSEKAAEEFLNNLKPFIDLTDATDYKPSMVQFDAGFNIKNPDDINNSKIS
tara:strand:+ start:147 stop:608 length:462 start_codon:yes stop_codon:yes gene_type:complete